MSSRRNVAGKAAASGSKRQNLLAGQQGGPTPRTPVGLGRKKPSSFFVADPRLQEHHDSLTEPLSSLPHSAALSAEEFDVIVSRFARNIDLRDKEARICDLRTSVAARAPGSVLVRSLGKNLAQADDAGSSETGGDAGRRIEMCESDLWDEGPGELRCLRGCRRVAQEGAFRIARMNGPGILNMEGPLCNRCRSMACSTSSLTLSPGCAAVRYRP